MTPRSDRRATRLVPAIAAVALIGTVVAAGVAAGAFGGGGSEGSSATSTSLAPAPTTTTAVPVQTAATTVPIVKTALSGELGDGSFGGEVSAVQQRLKDLGFDPGPIDGDFGSLTRAAVWAFEKLVMQTPRADATGRVTDAMWQRMQDPLVILPRRPEAATGNHTEIYLPEQVVIFFMDDKPALVTHMSSGTGEDWCEEVTISPGELGNPDGTAPLVRGECGNSRTPGGVFAFDRRREGPRESALGTMWNPVYFNFGIAIHGAINVPLEPASHGCIRIPMTLSEYFQNLVTNGDQVFVFDGVKEPEAYSEDEKMPSFNRIDPNYTTTTSTTTTLVPPTTLPVESPAPRPTDPPPPADPPAPPNETTTTLAPPG